VAPPARAFDSLDRSGERCATSWEVAPGRPSSPRELAIDPQPSSQSARPATAATTRGIFRKVIPVFAHAKIRRVALYTFAPRAAADQLRDGAPPRHDLSFLRSGGGAAPVPLCTRPLHGFTSSAFFLAP